MLLYSQGKNDCSVLCWLFKPTSRQKIYNITGMQGSHLDVCYWRINEIAHFDQYKYLYWVEGLSLSRAHSFSESEKVFLVSNYGVVA